MDDPPSVRRRKGLGCIQWALLLVEDRNLLVHSHKLTHTRRTLRAVGHTQEEAEDNHSLLMERAEVDKLVEHRSMGAVGSHSLLGEQEGEEVEGKLGMLKGELKGTQVELQ